MRHREDRPGLTALDALGPDQAAELSSQRRELRTLGLAAPSAPALEEILRAGRDGRADRA